MTPSPVDAEDRAAAESYSDAWAEIMRLVRAGASWSGHERNTLLLNLGDGHFADVSAVSGFDFPQDGRGLVSCDWDGDGDLDLWLRNRNAPRLRLLLNQSRPGNRWVSVRLKGNGRTTNRDGIGARVELLAAGGAGHRSVRTARAGSGFLSQSSKWLHFGLGDKSRVQAIAVDWPGGDRELFGAVATNGRYVLEQGAGSAVPAPARPPLRLEPQPQRPRPPTASAQIFLPGKVPLPAVAYTDAAGTDRALAPGEHPLLLLLYSGSCPTCGAEFAALTEDADHLRAAGLDVLALSVDGLSDSPPGETFDSARFPFATGSIRRRSADTLRHLLASLFDFPPPFSVPLGLLLDRERNAIAIYRGKTSTRLLLHDVAFAEAAPQEMRDLALPLRGRWFTKAIQPGALAEFVAPAFSKDFPETMFGYLETAADRSPEPRAIELRRRAGDGFHGMARAAAREQRNSDAEGLFRRALSNQPDDAKLLNDFGALLANLGQFAEAEQLFARSLEITPANEVAKKNLELLRNLPKRGAP